MEIDVGDVEEDYEELAIREGLTTLEVWTMAMVVGWPFQPGSTVLRSMGRFEPGRHARFFALPTTRLCTNLLPSAVGEEDG